MSGKFIRTGMGVDHRESRTDWQRLTELDDKAIDAAIAKDVDTYGLDSESLGRVDSAYHYEVFRDETEGYRWRLVTGGGDVLASSPNAFPNKLAVTRAIAELRAAVLGSNLLAA
jgi:uncharacterized protein YegP (UPF0339 family)